MSFILYPAIDVLGGQVTRLQQGDYARDTRFAFTPFDQARAYADAGAEWLHLVDLDGARSGQYQLINLLSELKQKTILKVQTGGGIRDRDSIAAVLNAGAARAVLGSVSVRNPERVLQWLKEFGSDRIVIAMDTKQDGNERWTLPIHGWTQSSDQDLFDLLDLYQANGAVHILCTDISRDGMLRGINKELYAHLSSRYPSMQFQASGGVAGLDDVQHARSANAAGVVLGRALLEGRFTLQEAFSC
jgi:phosphoribosylformimino-5-aminoimidazole carboxamide ribotide isomerase